MTWAESLVRYFKEANISLMAYIADANIDQAAKLMQQDPFFHVVSASREEEAIGIAAGAYAVGRNACVFMQSSGFGNCVNALTSLCIPYRIPVPMVINLRGQPGEHTIAQVGMGRATRPIMDVLGLPHFTLEDQESLDKVVPGALKLCYSSRQPLALCLTPMLHGGKIAQV